MCDDCQKIKDGMKDSLLQLSSSSIGPMTRICECGTKIVLQKKEGIIFQKIGEGQMVEAN